LIPFVNGPVTLLCKE